MDNKNPKEPANLAAASDACGYGKPPKDKQFKKGKSGNPSGRPKRSSDIRDLVSEILLRKVQVRDNGRVRYVSLVEAMVMAKIAKAMHGDSKSMEWLLTTATKPKSLTELMGNRPVFGFTKEEAARFTKEKMIKGMELPDDDSEVL